VHTVRRLYILAWHLSALYTGIAGVRLRIAIALRKANARTVDSDPAGESVVAVTVGLTTDDALSSLAVRRGAGVRTEAALSDFGKRPLRCSFFSAAHLDRHREHPEKREEGYSGGCLKAYEGHSDG
jgi:hypothetical protein